MTHFAALVLVAKDQFESAPASMEGRAFNAVVPLVNQYVETDTWGEDGTRYDWFQVGGRFTGLLDNYDPLADEANYERCEFCEGTGTTTQAVANQYPAYQEHVGQPCIQCNSDRVDGGGRFPGKRIRYGFQPHDGNVMPARNIDIERLRYIPSVIVTPDGEWHERTRYGMFGVELPNEEGEEPKEKDAWSPEFCRLLDANRDTVAVLIDFHV
jgi:hypothetical protein